MRDVALSHFHGSNTVRRGFYIFLFEFISLMTRSQVDKGTYIPDFFSASNDDGYVIN
jgi:hypothetical protein